MVETGTDTSREPVAPTTAAPRTRTRVRKTDDADAELEALRTCAAALGELDDTARSRVLLYLARRYEPAPRTLPFATSAGPFVGALDQFRTGEPSE